MYEKFDETKWHDHESGLPQFLIKYDDLYIRQ